MSRRKTERLLNLVICLLSTRRPLTAEQIRQAVPGYPEGDEAFKRMFERDKEELRELGVPIEIVTDPWEDDPGYRIPRQAYELPEITLEPDEAAVLGLAAQVWQRASLAEAASGALLKLRAAGVDTDDAATTGIELRATITEPAFPAMWEAVRDHRAVTFDYRAAGSGTVSRRRLEPWGVVSRRGRWYVVGYDRDRKQPRSFRLNRMAGEVRYDGPPGTVKVPADTDIRAMILPAEEPTFDRTATVAVRKGAADGLRHIAASCDPAGEDGWDELEMTFADAEWFAQYVAGFGPDAVVLDPPDVRDAIVRHLKGVVA